MSRLPPARCLLNRFDPNPPVPLRTVVLKGILVAFVCCCFACDCVLELVVCRVRFARVSCPRLRLE